MKNRHLLACGALLTALVMTPLASAAPVTPTYDVFDSLSTATFGGSGIPNDAVAIRSFDSTNSRGGNPGTITLGLTAHQRYSNPPLTNDGAGTFYANPGVNDGLVSSSQGALWNFGWYIAGDNLGSYSYQILYDTDPDTDTDENALASFNPDSLFGLIYGGKHGSQNLNFSLFGNSFDPMAEGEYSFVLRAMRNDDEAGRVAIHVVVGQPAAVPAPGVAALFGIGLLGAGFAGRRRARRDREQQ